MKTKLIQKIKEEFFKGQPTRDLLFEGKESPRAEFGYKVRRGNEIFTVVDWGNIWNFIEKAISQSKEEIKKKLRKEIMFNNDRITKTTSHWDEQDWTFYGKREALKDFLVGLNKK